jgi:hypothetical protein
MSSFEPETTGLYSVVILANKLVEMDKKIKVHAWTDNLAPVRRVKKIRQNNPPTLHSKYDSDLITGVTYLIKEMEIEINHVKGHQDGQGRKLMREEEVNVLADELTKEV